LFPVPPVRPGIAVENRGSFNPPDFFKRILGVPRPIREPSPAASGAGRSGPSLPPTRSSVGIVAQFGSGTVPIPAGSRAVDPVSVRRQRHALRSTGAAVLFDPNFSTATGGRIRWQRE